MVIETDRWFICTWCCKFIREAGVFLEHKKVCSKFLAGRTRNSESRVQILRDSNTCDGNEITEADVNKKTRRIGTSEMGKTVCFQNLKQKPSVETAVYSVQGYFKKEIKAVRILAPMVVAVDPVTETKVPVEVKTEESFATVSEQRLDGVKPEDATLSVETSESVISDNDSHSNRDASFNETRSENESEESDSSDSFKLVKQAKSPHKESNECKICDKKFSTVETKKGHDRRMHAETPEFKEARKKHQCTFCKKKFFRKQELILHVRIHTGEKPYNCGFCPKKFISTEKKKLHEKCMHGTDPTFRESFKEVCAICSKKFMSSYLLDLHMRSHTGRKPFSCDFCPKTFSQRAHKKAHTLCIHPDEEHLDENGQKLHFHQCSQCPKKFYSKPDFERHLLIHSGEMPFKCRFCPAKFNLAGNQNRHEIDVHNDKLDPAKMAGKHKCDWCSRIFHSKSELKRHEATHMGRRSFKCDHCNRKYDSDSLLDLHQRTDHQDLVDSDKVKISCRFCSKKSTTKSGSLMHEFRMHYLQMNPKELADRPKCGWCKRPFAFKSQLVAHEQTHAEA